MQDDLILFDDDVAPSFTDTVKAAGKIKIHKADGEIKGVAIKIPGYTGDGDGGSVVFSGEGLVKLSNRLALGPTGADPVSIALDTMVWDADGGCSFRLSHAPRARTLSLTAADVAEFGDFTKMVGQTFLDRLAAIQAADDNGDDTEG